MGISVAVITLNEERHIGACLDSVAWADEIIVVDSGSMDGTIEIAEKRNSNVFKRVFDSFDKQKNFALEQTKNEWVLFLDADERISKELSSEILKATKSDKYQAYYIPRNNIIFGKHLRYGGHQGDKHVRLFKKNVSFFENPIHEHVVVRGKVGSLEEPIIHYSTGTISEYIDKLNHYSTLEAEWLAKQGYRGRKSDMILKPFMVFLKRYFILFGFLDGFKGFVFYLFSAVNVFLKYAKCYELIYRKEGAV